MPLNFFHIFGPIYNNYLINLFLKILTVTTFNFTASTGQQADSETGKVIYQQFFYELVNYVNDWNCILFSCEESILIIEQNELFDQNLSVFCHFCHRRLSVLYVVVNCSHVYRLLQTHLADVNEICSNKRSNHHEGSSKLGNDKNRFGCFKNRRIKNYTACVCISRKPNITFW